MSIAHDSPQFLLLSLPPPSLHPRLTSIHFPLPPSLPPPAPLRRSVPARLPPSLHASSLVTIAAIFTGGDSLLSRNVDVAPRAMPAPVSATRPFFEKERGEDGEAGCRVDILAISPLHSRCMQEAYDRPRASAHVLNIRQLGRHLRLRAQRLQLQRTRHIP